MRVAPPHKLQVRFSDDYGSTIQGLQRLLTILKKDRKKWKDYRAGTTVTITLTIHESEKERRKLFIETMCNSCPHKPKTPPPIADLEVK